MNAAVSEPSLSALVRLLSEQALLAMGLPHPLIEVPPPANPRVARYYIDLLALLKDRTEGHRTEAETREIEDLLYHLRMRLLDLTSAKPEGGAGAEGARP